ncbi:TMEM165/GDT1 family protein [Sphingomonas sp. JC676]|uniref:TMEM165/GDT1 family protein n=1 Tax=Sphingomonas sp. JC676 TaxID=2768065 RepID=UPI0016580C9D|nr:TMEM165/GDT1 family protein [Sphingomonas sp. JC676]MBC9033253.1 TMEM165/GDT1 family protein [Sphingomonas sp. JC676]
MEAIVPAFLLAVLTQLGERPAALTAILSDRFRRPILVALAAGLAHAIGNGAAAAAGMAIAPMMTPNAQALFLAVALVFGGVGGIWPVKAPDRLERWRLGAVLTPLLGVLILAFGERTQFFTLAISVRGLPWLAAAGATIGAFAVAFVAAVLGEKQWMAIRFGWLRIGSAILFLIAGAWIGLGAVRLL